MFFSKLSNLVSVDTFCNGNGNEHLPSLLFFFKKSLLLLNGALPKVVGNLFRDSSHAPISVLLPTSHSNDYDDNDDDDDDGDYDCDV